MSCYKRNACWVSIEKLSTKKYNTRLLNADHQTRTLRGVRVSLSDGSNALTKPEIAEKSVLTLTNQKLTEPDQDHRTDSCHNDTTQETSISLDTQ